MQQIKTYRFKLKPTKAQEQFFAQWLGTCRYVYNLCLDYKNNSILPIQSVSARTIFKRKYQVLQKTLIGLDKFTHKPCRK